MPINALKKRSTSSLNKWPKKSKHTKMIAKMQQKTWKKNLSNQFRNFATSSSQPSLIWEKARQKLSIQSLSPPQMLSRMPLRTHNKLFLMQLTEELMVLMISQNTEKSLKMISRNCTMRTQKALHTNWRRRWLRKSTNSKNTSSNREPLKIGLIAR